MISEDSSQNNISPIVGDKYDDHNSSTLQVEEYSNISDISYGGNGIRRIDRQPEFKQINEEIKEGNVRSGSRKKKMNSNQGVSCFRIT